MMQKVVVFDINSSGERFAQYIEDELAVVDVIRVLGHTGTKNLVLNTAEDACVVTEAALMPYIGRVSVIVLASYEVTLATMDFLRHKYPEQKFVGFSPQLSRYVQKTPDDRRIMTLASKEVRQSSGFKNELKRLERFEIVESDYAKMIPIAKGVEVDDDFVRTERHRAGRVDLVLAYCNGFHDMQKTFERIYGWQVRILDDFSGVFRETCTALGFRGKDGGRGRY